MTQEEAITRLASVGAICAWTSEDLEQLEILVADGIAVRCDKIDHHACMLNPSYVFVSNDIKGRTLATEYPLFTNVIGHSALSTRDAIFGGLE